MKKKRKKKLVARDFDFMTAVWTAIVGMVLSQVVVRQMARRKSKPKPKPKKKKKPSTRRSLAKKLGSVGRKMAHVR